MLIVNTETIVGKNIAETLGIVRGNSIRAKHLGHDVIAGFRQILGGEMIEYTKMITETRDEATKRMVAQAKELGADAVVNVRYASSDVMTNAAEILCYGTAVKLK
jgi:uncharacterized protein YbjQ (UPF0145 family)